MPHPASRTAVVPALVALLAAPAMAPLAAQPVPRPLAIEDFYRLPTVGGVSVSADGRWVHYTVTHRNEATNADSVARWRVAADGRTPPEPLPPAPRGAGRAGAITPLVSPDGRWQAQLRDLPPEASPPAPLLGATDFERRHAERFKGRQFDWLNFQADGQPYPVPNRNDPWRYPVQEVVMGPVGAEGRPLTRLGLRPASLTWVGNDRLAFTADSAYRNERLYGSDGVYVVGRDGAVRLLTTDRTYDHTGVLPSPDGRWLLTTRGHSTDAVIAQRMTHGGPRDLVLLAADGSGERVLTADWDYLPADPRWSPDGRHIYFTGGIGGTVHLFRVAAAGGPVEQVTRGERRLQGIAFDSAFTRMAYTVGKIEAPAEVHVARIDGGDERQLTHVHDAFVREVALARAERLQFRSKDGTPVEGWLLAPPTYDAQRGAYPLVVLNHGGPHSADGYAFDVKAQYLAAQGYFVLRVNFRSSTGYGERFLWGTWGAWGDRDGEDVMAGIDHALTRARIDPARVATMGHSYGGFMSNWLITQYPDRFAAAIPGAGIVNWVSDYGTADIARTKETEFFGTPWEEAARARMIRQSPLTHAGRVRAPTLFVHGELDERVPYSEAEQMFVALKKNGVPAQMIQYAGMYHGITGSWNQVHRMLSERGWLDRWVRPGPSAPVLK